ncbi:MAG: serine/threonine protein kinase [Planctomycetota bacterium]|nr:MAG: serine/threonine protein kinase [Planctomycetota bacterium]
MPTLKPGQIIGGHEILGLHGKGGMGEIFRARQLSIGREVALKVLSPELARKDPQFAVKFVEEARGAGRLNHPNIVAVHDVGKIKVADRDEYLHYFSMEFIDGENLRQILEREGTCPQDLINRTMQGMVEALAYGKLMDMVHRDIKPENIMVTSDGRIKLADFGLAQHGESGDNETERDEKGRVRVMGTPRYMSPEQARGRTLDWRSDQYSLGATLFHLLTGSPPYRRESGRATMKAHVTDPVPDPGDIIRVSPAWRAACMRMMAKDPDERYQSTDELRDAVNAAATGKNLPSNSGERPIRHRARQRASARRSRGFPLIAAIIIIVVGAAVGMHMLQQEEDITSGAVADRSADDPLPEDAEHSHPIEDQDSEESDSSHTDHREDPTQRRAQEILDRLGDDHQQAITILSNNLTNPYYSEDSAGYQLLSEALEQRRHLLAEIRSQQREIVDQHLRRARRLATHGYFDRATRLIRDMDEELRTHHRHVIDETSAFILETANQLALEYRQSLGEADSLEALQEIHQRLQTHGFPPSLHEELLALYQEREASLREHHQQQQAIAASAAIREQRLARMLQTLQEARGTPQRPPNIGHFISVAASYRQRFEDETLRSLCQDLENIGRHALAMHQALQRHISEDQPTISIVSTGTTYRARINSIENHRLWVTIIDNGVRIRKALNDDDVDHLALVTQAHARYGEDADQLAAYCWMWQLEPQPTFGTQQLLTASRQFITSNNGRPQEERIVDSEDPSQPSESDITPIFMRETTRITSDHQDLLQWFQGDGATVSDEGLHWHCKESVRLSTLNEEALPTLHLTHQLSPPLQIRLTLQVHGGSLALVGLRQQLQAVRLGFDTRNMRLGGILSDDSGQIQSNPLPTANNALTRPIDLTIIMDNDGQIRFTINGTAYQAPPELFTLDPGSPVELVFQGLNSTNTAQATRVTISEIHIQSNIQP